MYTTRTTRTKDVELISADPFEFIDIVNPVRKKKLKARTISARFLSRSRRRRKTKVAIVQLHGSNGWVEHHHRHANVWVSEGIGDVLQIKSFESRGVKSTAERQIAVTMSMLIYDAFVALKWLRELGYERVALAGWSLGGGASVYAAMNIIVNAFHVKPFDAHLAFYPGLNYKPVSHVTFTSAPILICQGDIDDYTPTSLAMEMVYVFKNQCDANVRIERFANSHHSFDRVDAPVQYFPKVRACGGIWTIDLHSDGHMHLTGHASRRYETREDRIRNGKFITKHGAHMGGNPEQGARAFRVACAFLTRALRRIPSPL